MSNPFTDRLVSLCTAFLLAIGVLVFTPAVASAQVDNCTAVPDSGSTFDFTDACGDHDRCYIERPYGNSDEGRKQCDQDFLAAMLSWCADNWPNRDDWWDRATCDGVAWLYYAGVRLFGGFGWEVGDDARIRA